MVMVPCRRETVMAMMQNRSKRTRGREKEGRGGNETQGDI
jgi:hypothetical protein